MSIKKLTSKEFIFTYCVSTAVVMLGWFIICGFLFVIDGLSSISRANSGIASAGPVMNSYVYPLPIIVLTIVMYFLSNKSLKVTLRYLGINLVIFLLYVGVFVLWMKIT